MLKVFYFSTVFWTTLCTVCLLFFWHRVPPQVPLWQNSPLGVEQLANPLWLWVIVIVILFVGLFFGILRSVVKADSVASYLTLSTGLVVQLILGLGVIHVLWVIV